MITRYYKLNTNFFAITGTKNVLWVDTTPDYISVQKIKSREQVKDILQHELHEITAADFQKQYAEVVSIFSNDTPFY